MYYTTQSHVNWKWLSSFRLTSAIKLQKNTSIWPGRLLLKIYIFLFYFSLSFSRTDSRTRNNNSIVNKVNCTIKFDVSSQGKMCSHTVGFFRCLAWRTCCAWKNTRFIQPIWNGAIVTYVYCIPSTLRAFMSQRQRPFCVMATKTRAHIVHWPILFVLVLIFFFYSAFCISICASNTFD